jgi:hypothetical protein
MRAVTVFVSVAVVAVGVPLAHAADPATPSATDTPASDGKAPGPETAPPEKQEVPRLQIQDEGPSSEPRATKFSRSRSLATEDNEEKPLWKNWVFWTVAGVLVAGAVGMLVYTSSGSTGSLAPCPPDIVVSLGCFGAGRK